MKWLASRSRLAAAAAVLAATVLAGCSDSPSNEVGFARGEAPDEVYTDFVTQESDSGVVHWRLTAPRGDRYKDKRLVVLHRPSVVFYDEHGETRTTLVSDAGEYYEDRRDMLAYGNVVVRSVEGEVLETDSLYWNNTRRKILSDSFVKLTRGGNIVTGRGLECDGDLSSVVIKREHSGMIINQEGEDGE